MSEQVTREEKSPSLQAQTVVAATKAAGTSAINKRLLKQETHSKRRWVAIIVALVWALSALALLVESIRQFLGYRPRGLAFKEILIFGEQLPNSSRLAVIILVAVVFIILGLFLLSKAFGAGHLQRHGQPDDRVAFVIDDVVVASAISKAIREQAGLDSGQVTTTVAKNQINIQVKPTSGRELSAAEILQVAQTLVKECQLDQKMKVSVKLSSTGVVTK